MIEKQMTKKRDDARKILMDNGILYRYGVARPPNSVRYCDVCGWLQIPAEKMFVWGSYKASFCFYLCEECDKIATELFDETVARLKKMIQEYETG